jgi:hypothetical protein
MGYMSKRESSQTMSFIAPGRDMRLAHRSGEKAERRSADGQRMTLSRGWRVLSWRGGRPPESAPGIQKRAHGTPLRPHTSVTPHSSSRAMLSCRVL